MKKRVFKTGRIAILGRPNVGKSTLLNAFIGEEISIVSSTPQTTRDRILGIRTTKTAQFLFLDTPGLHEGRTKLAARMNQQARDSAQSSEVILFVSEATRPPSVEEQKLLSALPSTVPVVLILNKIDKVEKKADLLPLLEEWGKAFSFHSLIPVSARTKDGPERILKHVEELLPEGKAEFETDLITDRPERFIVAEYVREQILKQTQQEVPHGVAVVVEEFDEEPKVPRIRLIVHVDRESHKKIIIGKGGQRLKEIGTLARRKTEKLLGRKVHLELWVRVTPDWYQSDAKLIEMGYGKDS